MLAQPSQKIICYILCYGFSINRILYGKSAWTQITSVVLDTDIYIHIFPVLYCSFPIVLQFSIGTQVHEPVLRHQIVQSSGAAEAVARQMSRMIARLFSRRVPHIRQTPGNGSSFFS